MSFRVFRVFRGSFLCSLKNDPRITRDNTKALNSTFEAKPSVFDLRVKKKGVTRTTWLFTFDVSLFTAD